MTDGNTVFYGAAFERLDLAEQTGVVAHEVLHIALRHPQRALDLRRLIGDVDLRLFNTCADAIVNSTLSHLSWLRLRSSSVFLEQLLDHALGLQQEVEIALLEWDVERLYRAIDDRRLRDQAGRQQGGQSGTSSASEQRSEGRDSPESSGDPRRPSQHEDGPRAARVRELGAESPPDLVPTLIRSPRLKPRRKRPANGASGCCGATPATATSRCCAP